jgi:hypothetical protein
LGAGDMVIPQAKKAIRKEKTIFIEQNEKEREQLFFVSWNAFQYRKKNKINFSMVGKYFLKNPTDQNTCWYLERMK